MCDCTIPYSANTTNLLYHLQVNHPNEDSQVIQNKRKDSMSDVSQTNQTTVLGCFTHTSPYNSGSKRYRECEDALVRFVCKDLQPLCLVERLAFLQLVQTLDSRYKPPSCSHLSRTLIPAKYDIVKASVHVATSLSSHLLLTCGLVAITDLI